MKWNKRVKASIGVLATLCLIVIGVAISGAFSRADAAGKISSNEHLITIHDRGQEKSVITAQKTLRAAFKQNHIALDPRDIVEPGLDEPLVAKSYQVNVYRARPITIVDGTSQIRVMSAYQTPQQIAKQAGITLHDEDKESMSLPTNIVGEGASLQMTIDRATAVKLTFYGKKETVYTQATTVDEFLKEKNISLAKQDGINVRGSTKITADIKLEIWRNGTQTQTRNEKINFSTREIQDANHPVGYKKVQTAGENGEKTVTYKVIIRNGKEVKRNVLHSITIKKAKQQVVIIGTKVSLPSGSHEDWMKEAGISSDDYGYVNYIVSHEGGWEPCKVQGGAIDCAYSGSMGYGIVQATPGGKMSSAGSDWRTNPITQLRWATGYADGTYGGWAGAYNHWVASHNW